MFQVLLAPMAIFLKEKALINEAVEELEFFRLL